MAAPPKLAHTLGVPLLRFPASKLRWGEARRRCDAIKRPSDYLVNLAHAHLLKHARHCFFERGIATAVLAFEDDARFAVANGGVPESGARVSGARVLLWRPAVGGGDALRGDGDGSIMHVSIRSRGRSMLCP